MRTMVRGTGTPVNMAPGTSETSRLVTTLPYARTAVRRIGRPVNSVVKCSAPRKIGAHPTIMAIRQTMASAGVVAR